MASLFRRGRNDENHKYLAFMIIDDEDHLAWRFASLDLFAIRNQIRIKGKQTDGSWSLIDYMTLKSNIG